MWNKMREMFRKRQPDELTGQETEFLPAILEVTETPPSPIGRMVLWTVMILLVVGLSWSILGHVDEVAIANGKVIPVGQVKILQAEDKGVVKTIHVKEGQFVKQGDLLLELDQTFSAADLARLKKEVAYYQLMSARLAAEKDGAAFPVIGPEMDPKDVEVQLRLYQSRQLEYQAKQASYNSAVQQAEASLQVGKKNQVKYEQQLAIAQEREQRVAVLVKENAVSYFTLLEYQARRMELEQNLAAQLSEIVRLEGALLQSQQALDNLTAEREKDIATQLVEARKQLSAYSEDFKKADEKNRLARIVAPVDGRVNQLSVHTVGGVVTEAQALLMVVPEDVTMEVEAWAENKDIGFLHVGQSAEIKVETFNFQKFGTVDAEIIEISPDAVEDTKNKEKTAAKYRVLLRPVQESFWINERQSGLVPGMSVSAEIKIKQKRVIEFFLDPFRKYKSEALRER